MKYRKKPVVIEAHQYNYSDPDTVERPSWLETAALLGAFTEDANGQVFIRTLEGKMHVADGDWIIQGVKGELYPCKPDIFAATYEPAEQPQ